MIRDLYSTMERLLQIEEQLAMDARVPLHKLNVERGRVLRREYDGLMETIGQISLDDLRAYHRSVAHKLKTAEQETQERLRERMQDYAREKNDLLVAACRLD